MSVIGALLTLQTLAGLAGLDPTIFEHDEVEITPAKLTYIEAKHEETVVRGRPWVPHKRIGTIARGTRLAVRGQVASRDAKGCHGKPWYAVWPYGFVCSEHVRPTKKAPDMGATLRPLPGKNSPFRYATVRHQGVPGFKNIDSMHTGIVDKLFTKGMSMVIDDTVTYGGTTYYVTRDGFVVPRDGVRWSGDGSSWQGVRIENASPGPLFAWVYGDKVGVYAAPGKGKRIDTLKRRQRVWLYESRGKWRRIGPNRWVEARDLNEVVILAPPEGVVTSERIETTGNDQWIDVDTGEQVVVAYRGDTPIFATLTSTGARSPTPLGNYPLWAKVATIDMNNQGYEKHAYLVQGVPWVLLFQGHNALHGAYWHDSFGRRKSNGCVNLSPKDARWVFEWTGPWMPTGWTGYLPAKLEHSPVVHVRDSSATKSSEVFAQQRAWGPPDRDEEKKRLEEAEKRREETLADSQGGLHAPRSLFSETEDVPLLQR